jgi:hypothetical protein
VYVAGTFSKIGGTITSFTDDKENGNVMKDTSGAVWNGRGHAVLTRSSVNGSAIIKFKELSAGPTVNLSFNGNNSSFSGAWDELQAPRGIGDPSFTTITLKWDEVPGASGYRVYYSSSGAPGTFVFERYTTDRRFVKLHLDNDTTYYFRVSAENIAGEGAQSATISRTTRRFEQPMVNLDGFWINIVPISSDSIVVEWPNSFATAAHKLTNDGINMNPIGLTPIQRYDVYRSNTGKPGTWSKVYSRPPGNILPWNGKYWVDDGLDPDTVYYYKVIARYFDAGIEFWDKDEKGPLDIEMTTLGGEGCRTFRYFP